MEVYHFFTKHLVFAALLVSALWFYSGHQFVAKGKRGVALAWQVIAVLVLLAFCINAIFSGLWLSLIAALCFVVLEVWTMKMYWRGAKSVRTFGPKLRADVEPKESRLLEHNQQHSGRKVLQLFQSAIDDSRHRT
jgi:hypothetical protein